MGMPGRGLTRTVRAIFPRPDNAGRPARAGIRRQGGRAMRNWWKPSLALSLGILAGGARAADPPPAVQIGRPVIATAGSPAAAVQLNRPVPLAAPAAAVYAPSLRPTAYSNSSDLPPQLIRAQAPDPTDPTAPKPLP